MFIGIFFTHSGLKIMHRTRNLNIGTLKLANNYKQFLINTFEHYLMCSIFIKALHLNLTREITVSMENTYVGK